MRANERFFITGGALAQDAPSYIVRRADTDLYESLCAGEFCYVLDTRQSGKSSLKVRTATRLRQQGVVVVDLDLTRIGQPSLSEPWYYGLLMDIGDQRNLVEPLRDFWRAHKTDVAPLQRWLMALRQVVLEQTPGPLVLFLDEIDATRSLPFSTDEFFAGIRECSQRRTQDSAYERLTFCLLGVAAPGDLIRDVRTTPFNIGRRIELTDFTLAEATRLAEGFGHNTEVGLGMLERVLYWTGGHPYLTQRLCQAITEALSSPPVSGIERGRHMDRRAKAPSFADLLIGARQGAATPQFPLSPTPSLVDRLCAELFLTARARETDDNLAFVSNRILRSGRDTAAMLTLYRQVGRGDRVQDDPANPLVTELKLAGIVRVEEGRLRVRNRIYAREFDAAWVRESMPDAEVRRQREAYHQGMIRASSIYGTVALVICGLALATLWQKHQADRNANRARTAEAVARTEAANARRQLYFADMALAPRAWETSHIGYLMQLLDETKDNENRNWEWHYWQRLCHSELFAIPINGQISSVAISPDGTRLAIPNSGYGSHLAIPDTVKICDAITGRAITLLDENHGIVSTAFSSDGKLLALGNNNGTVTLWDVQSGRVRLTLRGHPRGVDSVCFSSDSKRLITLSVGFGLPDGVFEAMTKVWETDTGRCLFTLTKEDAAALSHDGRYVVTGNYEGIVRIWDIATGRPIESWRGSSSNLTSVAFSPDGLRVATGDLYGTVQVWDVAARHRVLRLKHATDRAWATFSPDGRRLLTWGDDGTAKAWEAQTGRLLLTLRLPEMVRFGNFYPDGRRIVTISRENKRDDPNDTVRVWDAWSDRHTLQFQAHPAAVKALAFSPDGKRLVTGGKEAVARIWEAATGRPLLALSGHTAPIYCVAYAPDGRQVVTGSDDSTARVWDAESGSALFVLRGGGGRVNAVAWSPDGHYIVTGHNDKTARVWDARTGREIETLQGHTDYVMSVACSPDSRQIVTASADYTAKLWDAASGHVIRTLPKFNNWLWAVAFSPE
ncbi:MAG TPA: AAA-like domain-containing protein, partial [Chthonomonadaceae bacterium]|nr:AAA-like domain-containing protein [Chthonomonadaceae bacterium]